MNKRHRKYKGMGIYKRLLYTTKDGIKVWLVDGEVVRNTFGLKFIEGGHDIVYSFIPKGEVWIEKSIKDSENAPVLLHELYERRLMESEGLSYNEAHDRAERREGYYRKNRSNLKDALRKEGISM